MFGPISETFKFLEKTSPVIQTFDWRTIKYMMLLQETPDKQI